MNNIFLIIIGASMATMIPRLLPFIIGRDKNLPNWLNDFLGFIPFTAVTALTFPSILTATSSMEASILGGVAAGVVSYKKPGMIIPILVSIIVTMVVLGIITL